MNYQKSIGTLSIVSGALLLSACSTSEGAEDTGENHLGEQLDYTITGTEPGAGLTQMAHDTIETYDNLEGWTLQESSAAGMITELDQAIQNEEPIIVTAWAPHWKFEEYDIKFLDDPELTFGETESIHTIARTGFQEDHPAAYQIVDQFNWTVEDMQDVMLEAREQPFEEVAESWVEDNQERVSEWTTGVEQGNGEQIELVSTPWDTERASSNVMKVILDQQGFNTTITSVDPAIMFSAIASGEGDVSLAPWLPGSHGAFMDEYGDDLEDLGENLEGARSGLAVPSYMDIDSIDDIPGMD
ncbi:glycine betaine ABC transporter substrate-binding protein [Marinilactibacillus kalidii]|uniref:glycine betaine ABC transporter substrate-binding protein n=1 Tax=Marinilactibacillus kalidii TaxID=2820274 RepID=UPI001ABE174A|nr:glycine betaine ABC transporter substrate-binding protein [Marinilactibacillus kalidii]